MNTDSVGRGMNYAMLVGFIITLLIIGTGVVRGAEETTVSFTDTISASLDPLWETEDWTTIQKSEWDAMLAEALGVYEDTQVGDVPMTCQHYAGVVYSYLTLMRESYVGNDFPLFEGALLIYNTMGEAESACWMSE